jgi:DNA-directed RNA polymerase specialized sigma subunit
MLPMSKLSDKEREAIRWIVGKGIASRHHIARVLNMSQSAISHICKEQTNNKATSHL